MRKSIKKQVWLRVALAISSVLLFSIMTFVSISNIRATEGDSKQASALLDRAQKAETAHYKWSGNLSNALYAGTDFTGSLDPTSCVLGQWLYGEAGTDDARVLKLREQMEPLHKELHQSASQALEMLEQDPLAAQSFYQNTIQTNLGTLVGMLDEVVACSEELSEASAAELARIITTMMITSIVCCVLALLCLLSLVIYVLGGVVKPILHITEQSKPLLEGKLELQLNHKKQDELGDLANTLEQSLQIIRGYVNDINRIMGELSRGSFNVHATTPFIGDFRSIEQSIESFTNTMSSALEQITNAEHRVSGNAEQLSSGAQALAQGATEQASAVEELFATLDSLSRTAEHNVSTAASAQSSAKQAREQVTLSSEQMNNMVVAMQDITEASRKISEIIATIADIAFQTNILALNAAVEAARAGSAGKGFAVVADEVRNLATKSDLAAKATQDLIENSVQAAERGSAVVDEVSQTLQRSLDLVVQASNEMGQIAEAIAGEAESIAQVTEGISQISAVVQTNSASSEESAAVSAELFDQVRLLQDQTRRFQLKD